MQLVVNLEKRWEDFESLEPEWNALLSQSTANNIFLTWEWIYAWKEANKEKHTPYVLTIRDTKGQLIAIAPMYLSKLFLLNIIPMKALRFLGDSSSGAEYPGVICLEGKEKEVYNAIWGYLANNSQDWDCLWAPNIAQWRSDYSFFSDCLETYPTLSFNKRNRDFSSFSLPSNTETYIASLSKSKRYDVRNLDKSFSSGDDISIRYTSADLVSTEDLTHDLELFFNLHKLHWESKGEAGSFVRNPMLHNFYLKFIPLTVKKGWLRLAFLEHNEKPIAAQLGYSYNNIFYAIQEGFDPVALKGSGNYLRMQVIDNCIGEGLQEYDFLGKHTFHKGRWGAKERTGEGLFVWNSKFKTLVFRFKQIWPTGRFLTE